MFAKAISALLLVSLACYCESKVYDHCELAQILVNSDISYDDVGTWVCIAEHESELDTTAINQNTWDYGIFQISSIYWCDQGSAGCGITCQDLLGDDITIDITCIKQIFAEWSASHASGFEAWTTYAAYCNTGTNNWDYVSDCFSEKSIKANKTLTAK